MGLIRIIDGIREGYLLGEKVSFLEFSGELNIADAQDAAEVAEAEIKDAVQESKKKNLGIPFWLAYEASKRWYDFPFNGISGKRYF